MGKTRLALEVACGAAENFPDGAAFAGLAPLADPALVVPTILRSLGASEARGRTPREALIDRLGDKSLLLVLDNLEHVLGAAPEVAALVEACPGLVVLATSRAPLRVRSEQEYPVPPLALPPSTRSPSEEEVLVSPSGRFFVERARAVSPGFRLTPRTPRRWRRSAGASPGCRSRWSWRRPRRGSSTRRRCSRGWTARSPRLGRGTCRRGSAR